MTVALPVLPYRTPTLPVSEVFGPVWQGEGPHAGRLCSFVRLGLCNLSCTWCDTPYTWDRTRFDVDVECPPRTAMWIADQLSHHDTDMVVLSGGEPLMHQRSEVLQDLIDTSDAEWHVETNGTIAPTEWFSNAVTHFTVSPKLDQGDPEKKRLKPKALAVFADLADQGRCSWKVVCATPHDVHVAADLFRQYEVPPAARWVMPEGTTPQAVMDGARAIAAAATPHRPNPTLRRHTLTYGPERAR